MGGGGGGGDEMRGELARWACIVPHARRENESRIASAPAERIWPAGRPAAATAPLARSLSAAVWRRRQCCACAALSLSLSRSRAQAGSRATRAGVCERATAQRPRAAERALATLI